jgi:hypothetical protein
MTKRDVGSIDKFPEKLQEYFGGTIDDNRLLADIMFKCLVESLCEGRYLYNGELGYARLLVKCDDHGRDVFRLAITPTEKLYQTLKNSKLDFISSAKILKKIDWMTNNNINIRAENERMRLLVESYIGNKDKMTVKEMIKKLREKTK